jgi:hypothetical protein
LEGKGHIHPSQGVERAVKPRTCLPLNGQLAQHLCNEQGVLELDVILRKVIAKHGAPIEERLHALPIARLKLLQALEQECPVVVGQPNEVSLDVEPRKATGGYLAVQAKYDISEYADILHRVKETSEEHRVCCAVELLNLLRGFLRVLGLEHRSEPRCVKSRKHVKLPTPIRYLVLASSKLRELPELDLLVGIPRGGSTLKAKGRHRSIGSTRNKPSASRSTLSTRVPTIGGSA